MVSSAISRIVILVFGTLYPAYASYKAVRTKNVKEYVKWMMYWIVFALFITIETFSDVFLSWFPFYYELKIVFVIWMLSPMTKGSNFLYRKFVHPQLAKRERDIDEMIAQASRQGYTTLLTLGTRGLSYATTAIARTALRGHGKLVDHLRRSYSTSDLSMSEDGSGLSIQRRAFEDDEVSSESEDELDNRLREDNAELDHKKRAADKGNRMTKSHTSEGHSLWPDLTEELEEMGKLQGLSSVKEEMEGEEEETVITTEEIVYLPTATTRKRYTTKEHNKITTYGTLPRSNRPTRTSRKAPVL